MTVGNRLHTCKNSCPSPLNCSLSGWSLLEYVVFSIFAWWVTYLLIWIVSRQSEEWTCRLLTFAHGSLVSYWAIRDTFVNWNQMALEGMPLSDNQKAYLSFSLSYFIYDYLWMQFFGNDSLVIHIHHICSIFILSKIMISNFGGLGVSFGLGGLELTNPYLQTRWFLRTYGYQTTPAYIALEMWFFFLFFLIRLVCGSVFFYYIQMKSKADKTLKLLVAFIYLVSLILVWDTFNYAKRKYWNRERHVSFLPIAFWGNPRSARIERMQQDESMVSSSSEPVAEQTFEPPLEPPEEPTLEKPADTNAENDDPDE